MSSFHDPVRQLKYLRQTLSQDKKPLGFFLAAGCPLAVQMPKAAWPLIPDIAGLTKFVTDNLKSVTEEPNIYDKLLLELAKTGKASANIEDILGFIRGLNQVSVGAADVRGFTEADLIKLETDVCKKIVEKLKVTLPDNKTPYHRLAKWIHNIERDSPIEIFTTNYDLLVEEAFEKIGVPYFDGFVGSRQPFFDLRAIEDSLIPKHWSRLWKIHGSINWFQKSNNQVYRSSNLEENDPCIIHPSHLKYDQSRKMPYLALIDRLNSFLRQNSAVLIMSGYSFSDEHLNDTIINALKANPTAMIISLLFETLTYEDENKAIITRYDKGLKLAENRSNLSIWTYDEAVIGGLRGKWRLSKSPLEDNENVANAIVTVSKIITPAAADVKEETEISHQLRLGDFSIFGDFVQELIGKEQFKIDDAK
jgi:hypothetical protein